MTKPYTLNQYERAALLALSRRGTTSAHSDTDRGFGKTHLDALTKLGLAVAVSAKSEHKRAEFQITDDGWRCMFGLSKAQVDSHTDLKPAPFRVWQWPLPAALKKAA